MSDDLESPHVPGLFLAGELTGFALVRTAVTHGSRVAELVADRRNGSEEGMLDLCIVGAGPAGLACSLGARERGLRFMTLDQDSLGGTVSHYPRGKMVMTHPVDLPLGHRLDRSTYSKEDLVRLWTDVVAQHELPVRTGVEVTSVTRCGEYFEVITATERLRAKNVCLALGRRGSPRKLGVPGEDLDKVAYSLIDAAAHTGRRALVVGGGDSAVEAALALAEQPGNRVTLSYRKSAFFRIKAKNEKRLEEATRDGRIELLMNSEVESIGAHSVNVMQDGHRLRIENDEVFVFVGGLPPFELLQKAGVSFDPQERSDETPRSQPSSGLFASLVAALLLSLAGGFLALLFRSYYVLSPAQRVEAPEHDLLSPSGSLGLAFGLAAALAMLLNAAYLLRRGKRLGLRFGALKTWMTVHVASGLGALLLVVLHSAFAPGDTVGGYSMWGIVILVASGTIGRYLYSFVPHAANGRELDLEETKSRLTSMTADWHRTHRELGERLQRDVLALVDETHWGRSWGRKLVSLVRGPARLRALLDKLREEGKASDIPHEQIQELSILATRAHETATAIAHFEDLRGILATWRWVHRWVALLVGTLVVVHVWTALRFSTILDGGLPW